MKATLGEACLFYSGTGFPEIYQGISEGEFPFFKVSDISSNVSEGNTYLERCANYVSTDVVNTIHGTIIPPDTVVFAKIGEALKKNRRAITVQRSLVDNNAMGILPRKELLRIKYFYYFMCRLQMEKYAEATAVPSVRKSRLEQIYIEIPSIDEQIHIEKMFDTISSIIKARQRQLLTLDTLIKARFVEMFGDPIANTKKLDTKALKDVLILKAGDFTAASDISDEPSEMKKYPCFGGNGIRGYVADYNQEGEYSLIGRQGALSGNVQFASGKFKNTEHALLVTPMIEMNSIWLNQLLINLDLKRYQTGAAQPGLSVKNLQEIRILSISIEEQNKFAEFARQIDKSKII